MLKLIFLLACLLPSAARADFWQDAWLDPALLQSHDLNGGSGFIKVPAPQSLPDGMVTGGIHDYQAELGRGFPYGFEAGILVQLDGQALTQSAATQTTIQQWNNQAHAWYPVTVTSKAFSGLAEADGWTPKDWYKENLVYLRWTPLTQGPHSPVSVSMGWEGMGMQDLGFKMQPLQSLAGLDRHYIEAGGLLPELPMVYLAAGYGDRVGQNPLPFGALAFAPFAGMAIFAEYNDNYTDLGVRVLFSTQIKLDLDFCKVQNAFPPGADTRQPLDVVLENNLIFGMSYSEFWP